MKFNVKIVRGKETVDCQPIEADTAADAVAGVKANAERHGETVGLVFIAEPAKPAKPAK